MSAAILSTVMVTSDGVRLRILEAGPRTADRTPVLAFVPGWSMPATIWLPQLTALGTSHRVAALDPRGQGDSDIPAEGFDIERRATDVREFIARYDRVVLIGWSLGALEALQCVHRYGDGRLDALVLVDSSVGEEPPPPATGFLEALQRDRVATVTAFVRDMFRTQRDDDELGTLVNAALRMPLESSLTLFPRGVPREHWRGVTRAFDKRLLYVVTEQFAAQAQNLLHHRPGTRIEIFERAGHALFVDDPDRFNQLLLGLLREIAGNHAG